VVFTFFLVNCASLFSQSKKEEAELRMRVGASHLSSGNYPMALSELLKAEELDSENPEIHNNLALVYFVRERFDLAEQQIKLALQIDPKYTDAKNNLARIKIELGNYPEAIKFSQEVIDDLTFSHPEKGWINLGIAQFKLNKFSEAKSSFLKAVQIEKDNCVANSYYGRSLFELKDYDQSTVSLDKAVGYCQNYLFDEPHYYSAMSYLQVGDKSRARARFEEIVKLYPNGKYVEKSRAMIQIIR
jgi:Tfp pilus assembly protein PilF